MEVDMELSSNQKMSTDHVGSNSDQGWRWKKMGDEEKMAAINEEMKRLQRLPLNSSYASHRLRILHKIQQLVSLNLQRTTSQDEELELLFSGLRL